MGTAGQVLSTTGTVTTWVDAAGGGGGSTLSQTLDTVSLTTNNTWFNWTLSKNMSIEAPSFASGTGAAPGLTAANAGRIYLKSKGSLNSLNFSCAKAQNGSTVEIYVVAYDYAPSRYTLVNKQILINETFVLTSNEQFAKTNFTIATNTLSDESILQVAFRTTVGTDYINYPVLKWDFAS